MKPKNECIVVRLSEDQKNQLRKLSDIRDQTSSEIVRDLLRQEIERYPLFDQRQMVNDG